MIMKYEFASPFSQAYIFSCTTSIYSFDCQVAYLIVDEMHAEHPELIKDQFWDQGVPDELPYTLAAEETRTDEPWAASTKVENSVLKSFQTCVVDYLLK